VKFTAIAVLSPAADASGLVPPGSAVWPPEAQVARPEASPGCLGEAGCAV